MLYPAELRAQPQPAISFRNRLRQATAALFALVLAALPLRLHAADRALVEGVDGSRLMLADGRTVVLAGLVLPDRPPVIAAAAARALHGLVDQEVAVEVQGLDRHGRAVVRIEGESGSVQSMLIEAGLAYAAPAPDRVLASELLVAEEGARRAARGLWAYPRAAEQAATTLAEEPGRFVVVVGTVRSVGSGQRWIYLNFGDDWRHDFTIRVGKPVARALKAEGLDVRKLEGSPVRVRGWLLAENGPMIELLGPGQIEETR